MSKDLYEKWGNASLARSCAIDGAHKKANRLSKTVHVIEHDSCFTLTTLDMRTGKRIHSAAPGNYTGMVSAPKIEQQPTRVERPKPAPKPDAMFKSADMGADINAMVADINDRDDAEPQPIPQADIRADIEQPAPTPKPATMFHTSDDIGDIPAFLKR